MGCAENVIANLAPPSGPHQFTSQFLRRRTLLHYHSKRKVATRFPWPNAAIVKKIKLLYRRIRQPLPFDQKIVGNIHEYGFCACLAEFHIMSSIAGEYFSGTVASCRSTCDTKRSIIAQEVSYQLASGCETLQYANDSCHLITLTASSSKSAFICRAISPG